MNAFVVDSFTSQKGEVYELRKIKNGDFRIFRNSRVLSIHSLRYVAEKRFAEHKKDEKKGL